MTTIRLRTRRTKGLAALRCLPTMLKMSHLIHLHHTSRNRTHTLMQSSPTPTTTDAHFRLCGSSSVRHTFMDTTFPSRALRALATARAPAQGTVQRAALPRAMRRCRHTTPLDHPRCRTTPTFARRSPTMGGQSAPQGRRPRRRTPRRRRTTTAVPSR
jgi:hypothetical protein